jgi:hypothetical protein
MFIFSHECPSSSSPIPFFSLSRCAVCHYSVCSKGGEKPMYGQTSIKGKGGGVANGEANGDFEPESESESKSASELRTYESRSLPAAVEIIREVL